MYPKTLRTIFVVTLFTGFLFCSCTEKPPVDPPPTFSDTIVKGTTYHITDNVLMKVNMESGSTVWQKNLHNGGGSALYYDSGYIYHRGLTGLSCYNSLNGNTVWQFSWNAFSDASYTNDIAFNDSLVFFSDQTSAWAPSNLYCLNKRSGALRWSKKIDAAGWANYSFYAIQVVVNENVITLSRDYNGHLKLLCLDVANGQQLWETPINDMLKATIKVYNNKIYCTGNYAFCYDVNNGALLWQSDLGLVSPSAYYGLFSFINQGKLYVAGPATTTATHHAVKTIDFNSGTILSSFNTPSSPYINSNRYQYSNNTVYAVTVLVDTFSLLAFDLPTATLKWRQFPYMSYAPPVISSKYIIYREFSGTDTDPDPLYLTVFKLDGERIRRIKIPGKYFQSMLYLDENNILFTQQSY